MASVQISFLVLASLPCDKERHILLVPPDDTEVVVAAAVPKPGPAGAESTDVELLLGQCERVRLFLPGKTQTGSMLKPEVREESKGTGGRRTTDPTVLRLLLLNASQ